MLLFASSFRNRDFFWNTIAGKPKLKSHFVCSGELKKEVSDGDKQGERFANGANSFNDNQLWKY